MLISRRHPETSKRPDFAAVSQQLCRPSETNLLKWTKEDKSTHPEVDKLGADLLCAEDLYKDLQIMYRRGIWGEKMLNTHYNIIAKALFLYMESLILILH